MTEPLLHFKSHVDGKNADVSVYVDRIEWAKESTFGKGKLALGAATGGLSLIKTGVKGRQQGSEMIPVKSISSVTTDKDGMRFTKVRIICSGNTIDFRVGHHEAQRIKGIHSSLVLGSHPAQQTATPAAPPAPAGDSPDIADQIRKLGDLKDAGLVTEAEFAAAKADLLKRL